MINKSDVTEYFLTYLPIIKFDSRSDAMEFDKKLHNYLNSIRGRYEFEKLISNFPTLESLRYHVLNDVIKWEGELTEDLIISLENCVSPDNPYIYLINYLLIKFKYE